MGKNKRRGRGGARPQTTEEPRREPGEPGPSRAHSSHQFQTQPPRFQEGQQSRSQQSSKPWSPQHERREDEGEFSRRMGGLNVEDEEVRQWGKVAQRGSREGGAWVQSHPQQESQRPGQSQPPFQQQSWPRPQQTQVRPQQTQGRGEFQQPQQSVSRVGGAWANGPPQDKQKQAQEKGRQPGPEKGVQPFSERPRQPGSERPRQPVAEKTSQAASDRSNQPLQQEEGGKTFKKRQENRPLPETQSPGFMDFAQRIYAKEKKGRPIEVYANFFPLSLEDYNITIFHYDVVFEPDVPKSLLRKAWNTTAEIHFPKRITVFDGMSNVYTKGPLVTGATFRAELNLYHSDTCRSKEYAMMIKEVRRIPMNTLSNYREKLNRSQTIDARKKALPLAELSVIEVILKNWPANNLIQHNRVFFPKLEMQPRTCQLSERLELRYGYFQSAFLGYKLYLNFDVAHRPFYKSDYIRSLMQNLVQKKTYCNPEEENHFLKGAKVEYTLPDDRRMKMIYRANRMVDDATIQTFEREGREMTVAEYFEKEKDFKLRYPYLPLLWVGPTSKTIYLPLELVRLVDDQIYRGALNASETRKMVSGATTDARRRKTETLQAFARGRFQENPYLKEFGIKISREMETVKARVLEPPKLKTTSVITVKEGAWKSRSFLDAKSFNRWCILNLDKQVDRSALINLQRSLQAKAKEFNMSIGEPALGPIDKGGTVSLFELRKIFCNLKDMTIVIVVIADTKGLYSRVKTICETQEGILTQCIRGKNITADPRRIMTTLDNLVLKINAKLGGTNHSLNRTSTPPCLEGYVMVVGADVTHAGPGSKIPSVAAVAVTCEVSAFQYGITIRVQNGEIIQDLKDIMRINLQNFHRIRKKFPEKIFFFRDGVSEGEMEKVLKTEYRALKDACDGVSGDIKITFLVVQKRHHTRFYATCQSDEEGKTFNVPVGTCVDSDVVHPGGLDFYLLSHGSLLGTARPTRYRLLHDDNSLTDDQLEQLTFYLCHLYARCNRSVSYPSPTYNAHLAAFRARAYLEGLNLTDKDDLKEVQSKLKDAISANYPMFFV